VAWLGSSCDIEAVVPLALALSQSRCFRCSRRWRWHCLRRDVAALVALALADNPVAMLTLPLPLALAPRRCDVDALAATSVSTAPCDVVAQDALALELFPVAMLLPRHRWRWLGSPSRCCSSAPLRWQSLR